ncbi:nuclear transport factor 2 family protein [Flavipsychrobacter stenotrophus]|uniref:nuclear transport factor 2 family protein n=1 Tax=Flavipsychrobacter stenotrophus TaxID=2077091 RepID=UPI00196A57D1|nr:nuclear transport factor 2 family protein [Flavipsychrobacter stenotrophus]
MITENTALHIGTEWVNDWNSHDLDKVMSHYADDIHFTSPFVIKINNDPTGVINSKPLLRAYFERALNAYPSCISNCTGYFHRLTLLSFTIRASTTCLPPS